MIWTDPGTNWKTFFFYVRRSCHLCGMYTAAKFCGFSEHLISQRKTKRRSCSRTSGVAVCVQTPFAKLNTAIRSIVRQSIISASNVVLRCGVYWDEMRLRTSWCDCAICGALDLSQIGVVCMFLSNSRKNSLWPKKNKFVLMTTRVCEIDLQRAVFISCWNRGTQSLVLVCTGPLASPRAEHFHPWQG